MEIRKQFNQPVYVCDFKNDDCTYANKDGKCVLFPDVNEARECQRLLKADMAKKNKEKRGGLTWKQIKKQEPKLFEYE